MMENGECALPTILTVHEFLTATKMSHTTFTQSDFVTLDQE
jgi:hypothetical protein